MSNDIYPLKNTTAYHATPFYELAKGRPSSTANAQGLLRVLGTSRRLVDIDHLIWHFIDTAARLRLEAQRHEQAARAIEIWRQKPMGATAIQAAQAAWELAEAEVTE
jgi:hypothetical protein